MTMRKKPFAILALIVLSGFQPLFSQDIRAQVRELSAEQKLALLDYMRNRGADIDRELQQVYEQLSANDREKSLMYAEMLRQDQQQPKRTTVEWDRDTIHYGKVEEGTVWLDSFVVTNTGPYPYLISETRTSCDCTVLHYPRFPVMPGEKAVVRVEFNSVNKIGKARAGIVLYDNSAPNLRTVLYLDGEIGPRKTARRTPGG